MRIALVILPAWSTMTPPLGISYIARALRNSDHDVEVFDLNIHLYQCFSDTDNLWDGRKYYKWTDPKEFVNYTYPLIKDTLHASMETILVDNFEAIGFSVFDTSLLTTSELVKFTRKCNPSTILFVGGAGVFYECINHFINEEERVDAAIVGEGDITAVELIRAFENNASLNSIPGLIFPDPQGNTIQTGRREPVPVNKLPVPEFSDFNFSLYKSRSLPIMMSRGCVSRCAFCNEIDIWKRYRMRSADHIIKELKNGTDKYGIDWFYLSDSLVNGRHDILHELVEKIIHENLNIHWAGYARIDKKLTFELLKLMKKAGCYNLSFGLESGSDRILKLMEKNIDTEEAARTIRDVFYAGINVELNLIVGFPGETEEDFIKTINFLEDNLEYISVVNTGETCGVSSRSKLGMNPEKYNILVDKEGNIDWGKGSEINYGFSWKTEDGTNSLEIRQKRMMILKNFLASKNLI